MERVARRAQLVARRRILTAWIVFIFPRRLRTEGGRAVRHSRTARRQRSGPGPVMVPLQKNRPSGELTEAEFLQRAVATCPRLLNCEKRCQVSGFLSALSRAAQR